MSPRLQLPLRWVAALAAGLALCSQLAAQSTDPLDEPLLPPPLGAVSVPVPPAGSLAGAQDPEKAEQPGSELDQQDRVRLLQLAGGPVLRSSSRWRDGHWEVERGGQWLALGEGMVTSARLEHRALAEWKDMRAAVRRAGPDQRLDAARWAFDAGLYQEGLKELDQVLELAPDHVGALLLLAQPALPFALPDGAEGPESLRSQLLTYGGRAPRSIQELVIRKLGAAGNEDGGLQADLEASLRSARPGERAFAALALRRLCPEALASPELLRRTVLDPYDSVRTSAALALRDSGQEGLTLPLVRALESGSSVIRTHAARSLGLMGFVAAVEPLAARLTTLRTAAGGDSWQAPRSHIFVGRQISYVQDFEPEVATNAVIANPQIGVVQEGVTLDVRVHGIGGNAGGGGGLGYSYNTETKALRRALASITGVDVSDTNRAWRSWWAESGPDWVAAHTSFDEADEATGARTASSRDG